MTDRILAARAAAAAAEHPEDRILADRAGLPLPAGPSAAEVEEEPEALPPIPDMPEDFFPTDMRIIMVEGKISLGLPITPDDSSDSIMEKLDQLRLRVWQAMAGQGWQQHEIVADPDTGVRHCRFCHAPEWQTQGKDAVPCVPKTFDAGVIDNGEVKRSEA